MKLDRYDAFSSHFFIGGVGDCCSCWSMTYIYIIIQKFICIGKPWLIDWISFYSVLEIFQSYNGGAKYEIHLKIISKWKKTKGVTTHSLTGFKCKIHFARLPFDLTVFVSLRFSGNIIVSDRTHVALKHKHLQSKVYWNEVKSNSERSFPFNDLSIWLEPFWCFLCHRWLYFPIHTLTGGIEDWL